MAAVLTAETEVRTSVSDAKSTIDFKTQAVRSKKCNMQSYGVGISLETRFVSRYNIKMPRILFKL